MASKFRMLDLNEKTSKTPAFDVVLRGGSPWGFNVRGGGEFLSMVEITQVGKTSV